MSKPSPDYHSYIRLLVLIALIVLMPVGFFVEPHVPGFFEVHAAVDIFLAGVLAIRRYWNEDRSTSLDPPAGRAIRKIITNDEETSKIIAPLLDSLGPSSETAIVLLQNGVGIEDDIYDALSQRNLNIPVISGCAWVDATAIDNGKTVTQYGNERLVIGYHKPPAPVAFSEAASKAALDHFHDLLAAAGGNVEASEIDVARWRKVLWCVIHLSC